MKKYNYLEAMKEDIISWIDDNILIYDFDSVSDLEQLLNDTLWAEDSVTGNASGSYTFSRYKAEECLCHNWDLLEEALSEFDCLPRAISEGPEYCDVTIRCYLLAQAVSAALESLGLVDLNGSIVNIEQCVNLMDDDIREAIHNSLSPCSNQEFLDEYCRRHEETFGEQFSL